MSPSTHVTQRPPGSVLFLFNLRWISWNCCKLVRGSTTTQDTQAEEEPANLDWCSIFTSFFCTVCAPVDTYDDSLTKHCLAVFCWRTRRGGTKASSKEDEHVEDRWRYWHSSLSTMSWDPLWILAKLFVLSSNVVASDCSLRSDALCYTCSFLLRS